MSPPILLALALASLAAPQEQNATLPPGPVAWNGRPHGQSAAAGSETFHFHEDRPTLEDIVGRLARARASILVDRDFAQAASGIDATWVLATCIEPFEGQREALVQVALLRSEVLLAAGDLVAARSALEKLLPEGSDPRWVEWQPILIAAPASVVELAADAGKDARLRGARAKLAGDARQGEEEQGLRATVDLAVDRGDVATTLQIGWRAAPLLLERIQADPGEIPPSPKQDPVRHLFELDVRRGAALLRPHVANAGFPLAQRVLLALRGRHERAPFLEREGAWIADSRPVQGVGFPIREPVAYECLVPEVLELLEDLLVRPETARECLPVLRPVVEHGTLTTRLQQLLGDALAGRDSGIANEVLVLLDGRGVFASTVPVYERGLASSTRTVRLVCAQRLLETDSTALALLAEDSDPEIRVLAAKSLGPRDLMRAWLLDGVPQSAEREFVVLPFDEPARALATRLLADREARVRRAALDAVAEAARPLEPAVFERLLVDKEPGVRARLTGVRSHGQEFQGRLLETLAKDSDTEVLRAVDEALERVARGGAPAAAYLPALRLRWQSWDPNEIVGFLESDDVLRALVSWALEAGDHRWLEGFLIAFTKGMVRDVHAFLALDDALLARWLAFAWTVDDRWARGFLTTIERAEPPRRAALRQVLVDQGADPHLRLLAARGAASDGGEPFREALLVLFRGETWKGTIPSQEQEEALQYISSALPVQDANQLYLAMARDRGVPDPLCASLIFQMHLDGPHTRELVQAILARWFKPDGPSFPAVVLALLALRTLPEDADPQLLAAAVRQRDYASAAVQTMGALRAPAYLPVLGRCLSADWIADDSERFDVQLAAADALGGYMDEAAAELLLQGLARPEEEVRQRCTYWLEQFRNYRDEVSGWRAGGSAASRESALADVLGLLEDSDAAVRAAAARSLATLGSPLEIPRLIRCLQDPEESVRRAAGESLERLNAAATAEPDGASGD